MDPKSSQPPVPAGFRLAGVYSGVKRSPKKRDLALVLSDGPATAAGVYTQNIVRAAPVELCRERTPSESMRAVVINSGNANACTGHRGVEDARSMLRLTAEACGIEETQTLVMSTGIIGEHLAMANISAGIAAAAKQLDSSPESLQEAASGILTTDKGTKIASRQYQVDGKIVTLTGIAKGAGMIAPNMATMLGLVLTDASISAALADTLFRKACNYSFNCTSVDGHMSTNDTAILMASGASGVSAESDLKSFEKALQEVSKELAKAIADDGEGATHLIQIEVSGCNSDEEAKVIARTVGNSPLVKTAVAGNDPNWGRIVSAAGYAGPEFDPTGLSLALNDVSIFAGGEPVPFNADELSRSMERHRLTRMKLKFEEGQGSAIFWASDLTHEYVRINAEYHT